MYFCVYKVAFRLIDIKHDFASHGVKTSFEMCKTSFSNAGLWSASSKITSNGSFCSGLWGFVSFGCTVSSLLSQTLTLPHPPNLPVDKQCLRRRRLLVALNRTFVWPTSVDVRHRSTIPLQYTNPFLYPPIIVGTISPTSHNTHCHGPDTTASIVRRTLESRAMHMDSPSWKLRLGRIFSRPNLPSCATLQSTRTIAWIPHTTRTDRREPRRHAVRQSSGRVALRPESWLWGRIPSPQSTIRRPQ